VNAPRLILREKPEDGFVKLDNIVASLVQAAKLSKLLTTTAITI
jgi:hypothetical protein